WMFSLLGAVCLLIVIIVILQSIMPPTDASWPLERANLGWLQGNEIGEKFVCSLHKSALEEHGGEFERQTPYFYGRNGDWRATAQNAG
ncbi:hypothetical protein, partial [Leisingera sp. MMG026]|uniref:hypothetical protein n=1 Tax=Leisingera sp. MMG026 TaxID=2909982 RepID=UPI001F3112BE